MTMSLRIGDRELVIDRVAGTVAVSRLFRFEIDAVSADGPSALDSLGQPAALALTGRLGAAWQITGITTEVAKAHRPDRPHSTEAAAIAYRFTVEPEVASLTIGRDSRVFQDMKAEDIVADVLARGGIASDSVRWELSASYVTRKYCAQYEESDWRFVERLLAEEGIGYRFEFDGDKSVIVFFDDSTQAPPKEGEPAVTYRAADGMLAARESVSRVALRAAVVPTAARLTDYNHAKPRLALDVTAGEGDLAVYDHPGGFEEPSEGRRRAAARLDALAGAGKKMHGTTDSLFLWPGRTFEICDHSIDAFNTTLFVESIRVAAGSGRGAASEGGVTGVRWVARPIERPYRPPVREPERRCAGPHTGVVVGPAGEEIHPDDTGRTRVQFYWDRTGALDETASRWMRVGQFPMNGSMILPRIGWDMIVHHHEGDIDEPVVTSHLYDGAHPVPYALPANKTRTAWQTATSPADGTSSEIRFEDQAGSEELFINAAKDMNAVVGDRRADKVGVDSTESVGADRSTDVGANMSEDVGAGQTVSVGGSESLTVTGARTSVVAGSETITIGGSRTLTAIKGNSLDAKASRSLTVGGSMLSVSALGVNRAVLGSYSVTVGGAWIMAAATGLDHITGGAGAETVGGAKICAGAAGVQTSVRGALAETVGGAYAIAAGGNAGEAASSSMAITVGGAFTANAPSIEIKAKSKIEIRVGGASLKITASSIELKAPTIALPAATTAKKGSSIKHN